MMVAVLIAVAISAPSLFAQSTRLSATIPFDFYVSDQLFPAGTYTVAPGSSLEAIRLFDNRGNSVFLMTQGQTENKSINLSRLIFHRYGDSNFLASIFWEGYKTGRNLATSKAEKKLAQSVSKPAPVAIQLK
jgi:hypothetical protein